MQLARVKVAAGERLARVRERWAESFPGRCVTRALDIHITDRMMALAAQAFLALMPLVLVVAAEAPEGISNGMIDAMRTRLGLGGTAQEVRGISGSESDSGVTAVGFLIVLLSATSFSRALQRVYERCWRLTPGGLRSAWRPLAWIVSLVVYFVLLGLTFKVTHGSGPLNVLRVALAAAGALAMWWWTPFVLLSGRVHWRALVPTALTTAAVTLTLGLASSRYVPHALSTNESRYGTIGVAFAIESWLVALFALVLAAGVVGVILVESSGRLGAWARGADDPDAWRRTPRLKFVPEDSAHE
ncbi:YhjD/YihY/BrkB family envelope integrity protein [Streptomyces sp. SID3343]|uniref:YhjD/YihY/BrkB family envelope integrity protein n=1 Tax=Streptomyces sp. SID3343 TaxID=2690260 RepID=UPI001367B71C|nr:YhjD/YihY/BrkB family envelope integrity protein [Streptomyces sp. SID3343]MYW01724.1 hypothetical protein [Streptomyces sp. SID3343]